MLDGIKAFSNKVELKNKEIKKNKTNIQKLQAEGRFGQSYRVLSETKKRKFDPAISDKLYKEHQSLAERRE